MKRKEREINLIISEAIEFAMSEIQRDYRIQPLMINSEHFQKILSESTSPIQQASSKATRFAYFAWGCSLATNMARSVPNLGGAVIGNLCSALEVYFLAKTAGSYFELSGNFPDESKASEFFFFVGIIYSFVCAVVAGVNGVAAVSALMKGTNAGAIVDLATGSTSRAYISALANYMVQIKSAVSAKEVIESGIQEALVVLKSAGEDTFQGPGRFLNTAQESISNGQPIADDFLIELRGLKGLGSIDQTKSEAIESIAERMEDALEALSENAGILNISNEQLKSIQDIITAISKEDGLEMQLLAGGKNSIDDITKTGATSSKTVTDLKRNFRQVMQTAGITSDQADEIFDTYVVNFTEAELTASLREIEAAESAASESLSLKTIKNFLGEKFDGKRLKALGSLIQWAFSSPTTSTKTVVRTGKNVLKARDESIKYFLRYMFKNIEESVKGQKYLIKMGDASPVMYEVIEYLPGGVVRFRMTPEGFSKVADEIYQRIPVMSRAGREGSIYDNLEILDTFQTGQGAGVTNEQMFETAMRNIESALRTYNFNGILSGLKELKELTDVMRKARYVSLQNISQGFKGKFVVEEGTFKIADGAYVSKQGSLSKSAAAEKKRLEEIISQINSYNESITIIEGIYYHVRNHIEISLHELNVPSVFNTVKSNLDQMKKGTGQENKAAIAYQQHSNSIVSNAAAGKLVSKQIEMFSRIYKLRYPMLFGTDVVYKLFQVPESSALFSLGIINPGSPATMIEDATGLLQDNLTIDAPTNNAINIEGLEYDSFGPGGALIDIAAKVQAGAQQQVDALDTATPEPEDTAVPESGDTGSPQ
jgi:hypothetical protein